LAAIARAAAATTEAAPHFTDDVWHNADQEFHHAISDASGNPYIAVAIDAVRQMQRDVTRLVREMRGSAGAAEQHRAIAEAIAARCPERAAAAMRAHIQYTADRWQQAQKVAREAGGA
jgi:DNA-binding FadR family transcriptional regulator